MMKHWRVFMIIVIISRFPACAGTSEDDGQDSGAGARERSASSSAVLLLKHFLHFT